MTTPQPSARHYLAEHNPAALTAYNVALRVLAELIITQLRRKQNDDQRPIPIQHSFEFDQASIQQSR